MGITLKQMPCKPISMWLSGHHFFHALNNKINFPRFNLFGLVFFNVIQTASGLRIQTQQPHTASNA